MKTYKSSTKIYSLIYSIKILGLLLLISGLIRCKCGILANSNPRSSQTPPAPDKPKDPNIPDHTDTSAKLDDQQGNRTAITEEMLDRVKNSSLDDTDKQHLRKALKSFRPSKSSKKSEKLSSTSYEWALGYAINIEDGEIIQALLERKDQVEGNIDWDQVMKDVFKENKEVGLKTLLKSGVEANQKVLQTIIRQYYPTPNVIKILLDPQQNPQAPTLNIKELLEELFNQVANYEDPEGKIKATFFAFLDPNINPQFNELKINKEMLTDVAVHHPQPDVLEKLFNTFTISLTDEEVKDLISNFAFYKNLEKTLKAILEGLIKQKGLPAIQRILKEIDLKRSSTIGMVTSQRPEYKAIFIQLKLLEE